jgi:hypothetical protein
MAEHNTRGRSLPWGRWINVLVVAGIILLLLAVLIPAILNARDAARMAQSKNNLKQVGLAFHNYHDVYGCFPLGTSTNSNGNVTHGWTVGTLLYLDQSAFYSMVNMNLPWDDPANEYLFQQVRYPAFQMHGVEATRTSEGYWLTHYMANPNVCHRRSCVSISQMTSGTSNNWLCGEVSGNYQPWGYPFNWRPLSLPFNKGPNSYGRPTGEGTQICYADGSVGLLANSVASEVVDSLRNAEPIASVEDSSVPNRQFVMANFDEPRTDVVLLVKRQEPYGTDLNASIRFDLSDAPDTATFSWPSKGDEAIETSAHIAILREKYPNLKHLIARRWSISDDDAKILLGFTNLQTLQVADVEMTQCGLKKLQSLNQLTTLVGFATEEQKAVIAKELPNVESHNRL